MKNTSNINTVYVDFEYFHDDSTQEEELLAST